MVQTSSVFRQSLVENLRKAVIVVAVVALGLGMYALANGEEVQWKLVLLVAAGMLGSAFLNAGYDAWKKKV